MKIEQLVWLKESGWSGENLLSHVADLVFVFADRQLLNKNFCYSDIRKFYPKAKLVGCSTSGEIHQDKVIDNSIAVTAIGFDSTKIAASKVKIIDASESYNVGRKLASQIEHQNLTHVMIFSVGLGVNGSALVQGLTETFPKNITISGGLAGDQDHFTETLVMLDDDILNDEIVILGFYGSKIKIQSASLGGWDPFGTTKIVTKSSGNVLYELDGKSALDIYKSLLGNQAQHLPGSALLFPLCITDRPGSDLGLVRTILAVDEVSNSMTFAGDIPQGAQVRFMKANFDRLVEGAKSAAEKVQIASSQNKLAILVSCVGRKLVLKSKVNDEVLAVRKVLGDDAYMTGFYSYGEISPFSSGESCQLHNQTMTITTFVEE